MTVATTTLPDRVRDALTAVGRQLQDGRSTSAQVDAAVQAIAHLSLDHFMRDANDIATLADLASWRPPSIVASLFRGGNSEQAQLARTPSLGWLFLFHRSGYLREAALARLQGPAPGSFLFAALVYRTQ
jgi:hypothetical protein